MSKLLQALKKCEYGTSKKYLRRNVLMITNVHGETAA